MSDIDDIKEKIDIVSFVGDYVTLRKSGRNFTGLCPFHSEKSPSFIVSPDRQIWHCFGACNEGGDVISFLMKVENIDFPEALDELSKQTGIKLTSSYHVTEDQKIKKEIYKANDLAGKFYHYLLTTHPLGKNARKYVLERGINEKVMTTFMLGYAPESWDSLYTFLKKRGFSDFILAKAGLVIRGRSGTYFDRFRGRLMFALYSHRGDVVGFSGRILPFSRLKDREAKYINTSETPVYIKGNTLYGLNITKDAIRKEGSAVIVEGEFDLLSSFQAGVSHIVAIKGTALTTHQAHLLKRFADTVIFALDQDIAGNEASKRGIDIAEKEGLAILVVDTPLGKDPDETIKEDPLVWKKAIKDARSVYDYILNSALKKFNKNDAYGKKKIAYEILPFYSRISNSIVQTHYLSLLSKTIDIPEDQLRDEMNRIVKKQTLQIKKEVENNTKSRLNKEEYMLALLLQNENKQLVLDVIDSETYKQLVKSVTSPGIKKIIEAFYSHLSHSKEDTYDSLRFIKTLESEIIPIADKCYLYNLEIDKTDANTYQVILSNIIKDITIENVRRKLKEISTQLSKETDEEKQKVLNKEFTSLRIQLKKLDSRQDT